VKDGIRQRNIYLEKKKNKAKKYIKKHYCNEYYFMRWCMVKIDVLGLRKQHLRG
jgi:hypothetical protein